MKLVLNGAFILLALRRPLIHGFTIIMIIELGGMAW